MIQWWNDLTLLEQIFACIAAPATLLLLIQTVLAIIGFDNGESDADGDVSTDADSDGDAGTDADSDGDVHDGSIIHDGGLRVFTVRGIIAFFAVFGWIGLSVSKSGAQTFISVASALIAGIAAMVLIALIFKGAMKLQHDGTLDIRNALGVAGTVYITVPAARDGKGKVNVIVQGALTELDAVSDSEEPLKYGTEIVVIGVSGSDTLVVKKK